MFRWDKWLQGAFYSGLVAAIAAAGPMFADGEVTKPELYMLISFFLGGIALWCKSHPVDPI